MVTGSDGPLLELGNREFDKFKASKHHGCVSQGLAIPKGGSFGRPFECPVSGIMIFLGI